MTDRRRAHRPGQRGPNVRRRRGEAWAAGLSTSAPTWSAFGRSSTEDAPRGLEITFLSSAGESQRATESSDGPPVFWKAASRVLARSRRKASDLRPIKERGLPSQSRSLALYVSELTCEPHLEAGGTQPFPGRSGSWVIQYFVSGVGPVPNRALTAHRRPAATVAVVGTSRPGSVISPSTVPAAN